jgi:tetratricopeptide (TPR) repeat protein
MRTLRQDLRYNARILLKTPGFKLVAVLTLALSIDTNTVTFGVVEGKKAGNTFSTQEANQDNDAELIARAQAKSNSQAWAEAAVLWTEVVTRNPVNGSFWHQLASAHYRARDYRQAIPAYQKVIALGAVFPSSAAYQIARCYAALAEKDAALKWLEQAFEMGFRDLQAAQTDADWENLRDDPRYRRIVALADVTKLSRNEGWRHDLRLLAGEVKRKGYAFVRPISKEEFDVEVKKLYDAIPGLTDMQITIEMMKLLRRVGDGHTGLLGSRRREDWQQTLPMQFYQFEEGLFIIAADPRYKELLGAQVLRFGERTVDQVTSALEPLIYRDNDIWVKQRAPYLMRHLLLMRGLGLIPSPEKVTLSLSDTTGKARQVEVVTDLSQPNIWNALPNPSGWINMPQTLGSPPPLYLKNMAAPYWFEHLPERKTVYFQFNAVRNDQQESLAQFCARLFKFIGEHEVEKLVIDMRWNNGGNTGLLPPLIHGLIRSEKINQRGKLFVIIGRRTFSAAQNAATYIERHTNATFVGEPTGSSPNFIEPVINFKRVSLFLGRGSDRVSLARRFNAGTMSVTVASRASDG